MSLRMEAYLTGMPELQATLKKGERLLPMVVSTVRDSAMSIQAEARARAPIVTGRLRNSIRAMFKATGEATVEVDAPYALAVHEGTRPHLILGRPILSWLDYGRRFFAKFVRHPGTRAQPFFKPVVQKASARLNERIRAILFDFTT